MKAITLTLAGLLMGLGLLSSTAEAGDHWRWRVFHPQISVVRDLFCADDYCDDDSEAYDEPVYGDVAYDDEDTYVVPRPRRQQWWQENAGDLEPVYVPRKKKVKIAAPYRPATKPVVRHSTTKPLTDLASARAKYGAKPVVEKSAKVSLPKPTVKLAPIKTASLTPIVATRKKTIGCTAGAAVVTGYGFGNVQPKACTGETYAYGASRDGKSFVIKLSAASGEITDVKKLN